VADPTTADRPSESGATAVGGQTSTGELVSALSQQTAQLVRSELALAKAEMSVKAKKAGLGAGMFGGAGLVALYGVGALVATIILALALVLPPWLAALIVTVVLFAVAGVMALLGKKQVTQATPLKPEQATESVKQDVATVKGAR
jgi:hypothetical protein